MDDRDLRPVVPSVFVLTTLAGVVAVLAGSSMGGPDVLLGVGLAVVAAGLLGAVVTAAVHARQRGATFARTLWVATKTALGWLFAFLP